MNTPPINFTSEFSMGPLFYSTVTYLSGLRFAGIFNKTLESKKYASLALLPSSDDPAAAAVKHILPADRIRGTRYGWFPLDDRRRLLMESAMPFHDGRI